MKAAGSIFGIVGRRIGYSLSPIIYNELFAMKKFLACYKLFDLETATLEQFVNSVLSLGIDGFNVTIPFKNDVAVYLQRLDKIAAATMSVNQVMNRSGALIGYNTDYYGIAATIEQKLAFDVRGRRVALIGCGGSARTVYYYLVKRRAREIAVYHRSGANWRRFKRFADSLDRSRDSSSIPFEGRIRSLRECDLCINATPVPLSRLLARPSRSTSRRLFELRYTGRQPTSGLAWNGTYMLAVQAARNFKIMTGADVAVDRIMSIIRKARRR